MEKEKYTTIAVDGYSSCGKSTLAKDLAKTLGFTYIDSGAMYRAVTLFAMQEDIAEGDENKIIDMLDRIRIDFRQGKGTEKQELYLNGKNVESEIRQMAVAQRVSHFAKIREVRTYLVALQRRFADFSSVVMDGRDIGTVVFPNADLKIFMTADPMVRAKRRFTELEGKGIKTTIKEVLENLQTRDYIDENRKESPLRKAENAFVIDNSNMNREEQLQLVIEKLRKIIK